MLRRWREEIGFHEGRGFYMAPIPPAVCDDVCHCYRGPGYFRKCTPLGCSCGKNGICSIEKWLDKRTRGHRRRAAIRFELDVAEL